MRHLIRCLVTGCLNLPKSTTQPWVRGSCCQWHPVSHICMCSETKKPRNNLPKKKKKKKKTCKFFYWISTTWKNSLPLQKKIKIKIRKKHANFFCWISTTWEILYLCREGLAADQRGQGWCLLEYTRAGSQSAWSESWCESLALGFRTEWYMRDYITAYAYIRWLWSSPSQKRRGRCRPEMGSGPSPCNKAYTPKPRYLLFVHGNTTLPNPIPWTKSSPLLRIGQFHFAKGVMFWKQEVGLPEQHSGAV